MNHCAVHVRKYQANKSVITLSMQKDIDSGGGAAAGYPPKNMTMQIKDGNCNAQMGIFQTLYHLFESEYVILSPLSRIFRSDPFLL